MTVGTAPPPRIKICCIASVAEARLAVRHGAAAIGLVSEMPSGPGVIAEAIATVRPFGVDVCSGVRTDGRLDESKLAAFVAAVRGAAFPGCAGPVSEGRR